MHETERYPDPDPAWDKVAAAWERFADVTNRASRDLDAWMLDRLDPRPGGRYLDIAAGAGGAGLQVAARLGGTGTVVLLDQSAGMLQAGGRQAAAASLSDIVELCEADAEALPFDDGEMDGAICRFGIMLMPEPARALAEARRVIRQGGRLVIGVWAAREDNPWAFVTSGVLNERGLLPPPSPDDSGPGMFVLADRERLTSLLRGAGFEQVEVEEIPVAWPHASFDTYWETVRTMSPSMSTALDAAPPEEVETVRELARARYQKTLDDHGRLPGRALAAAAR